MMKTFAVLFTLSLILTCSCDSTTPSESSDSNSSTEKSNNVKRQVDVDQTTPPCSLSVFRYLYGLPGTQIRPNLPAGTVIFNKPLPPIDNSLPPYSAAGSRLDTASQPAQRLFPNSYPQAAPTLQGVGTRVLPAYQPAASSLLSRGPPPPVYSQTLVPKVSPYPIPNLIPVGSKTPTFIQAPPASRPPAYSPLSPSLVAKASNNVPVVTSAPSYTSGEVSSTPASSTSRGPEFGSRIDAPEPEGNGQDGSSSSTNTDNDSKLSYLPPNNNYLPPPPNPSLKGQSVPPVSNQGKYFIPIGAVGISPTPNPEVISPGSSSTTGTDDAIIVSSTPSPDVSGDDGSSSVTPGYPPFSSTIEPDYISSVPSFPFGGYPSTPSPDEPIYSPTPSPGYPVFSPSPSPEYPAFSPTPSPDYPAFSPTPSPEYPSFSPSPNPPAFPDYPEQDIFQQGGQYPVSVGGTRCTCEDGQVFIAPNQNYPLGFEAKTLIKNVVPKQPEVIISSTPKPVSSLRPIVVQDLSHRINEFSTAKPFIPASPSSPSPLPVVVSSTPAPPPPPLALSSTPAPPVVISSTPEPAPVLISSTPVPGPVIFSGSTPVPPVFLSTPQPPLSPVFFSTPAPEISSGINCVTHLPPSPAVIHTSSSQATFLTSTLEPEVHIFESARISPKVPVPILPNIQYSLPSLPPKEFVPFVPQPLPAFPPLFGIPPSSPVLPAFPSVAKIPSPPVNVYPQPPSSPVLPAFPSVAKIPSPPVNLYPQPPLVSTTLTPLEPSSPGYQYPTPDIPFSPSTEAPLAPSPAPTLPPSIPSAPDGGYHYPKPAVPFPLPSESGNGNENGYHYPKPKIPFSLPEKAVDNDNLLSRA